MVSGEEVKVLAVLADDCIQDVETNLAKNRCINGRDIVYE